MAEVAPDNNAAIEFLQRWLPEGPWVLTAIQTDRKSIATQTFYPASLAALQPWLEQYNGKRNLYFHVNRPIRDLSKKADREDIRSVDWFHIDIDPRAGEDLDEERTRALSLLRERLPKDVPAPTCIIFSGGGYQGFWRLEEPIPIDGDLAKAEDAKRYNQQLELLFGADNCHNIDRIMRLPGTINLPDARKVKKGRTAVLASVVEFNDNVYGIKQFTKAPIVQMDGGLGFGGDEKKVKVSSDVERIEDLSELDRWDVPDRVKIIMVQGNDPDKPKKGDNSRSSWLFDFCCQMVRAGVPDETIFAIITDPRWSISESVLEHKRNATRYALKQIGKAKEWVIEPALVKMNEKYAVIKNMGGRCLVVSEMHDYALKRTRLVKTPFSEIEKAYKNKKVKIGEDANGNPKHQRLGQWWLEHPSRRQYENIVFAPEEQVPPDIYNLWKGFAVESIPGDCSLFLEHVRLNVCCGNEEHFTYLMGWMARTVQEPAKPGEVAIVMRGGRGVGKSFFAKTFGALFGRHYMQVSNSNHLVGNFNSHLRDLIVLFADEAFFAGDKRHESILKTLVTEEMMTIEAKGIDVENAPNYIHLIMAANDMHVIPAGGDERRFFVVDVGTEHQKDSPYFIAIKRQMEQEKGYEALLHTLLTYNLEGYEVRRVPHTDALHEQKLLSLKVDEEWWYNKLVDGRTLRTGDDWDREVAVDALVDDYQHHTQRFNITRRGNQVSLGRFMRRVCPTLGLVKRRTEVDEPSGDGFSRRVMKRVSFYRLPSLQEARERWCTLYGEEAWDPIETEEELPMRQGREPPF